MLPIEIVNKILVYVSELNNDVVMTQYKTSTNKKYYKINFNSDYLWKIKSTLIMKRFYPVRDADFHNNGYIQLYKFGIEHYEQQLRLLHKIR